MKHPEPKRKIIIIAGEVSGDMHAAELVRHIHEIDPDISFSGIGGPAMRDAGVNTLYDISDMAVMGLTDVILKYPFFLRVFNKTVKTVIETGPDAVILVDYPGFNLRFAEKVHKMGIKTIYYICPQVWAWNRSRIPKMAGFLDCLITLFPFEKKYFENTGLHVEFAGNPLVDRVNKALAAAPQQLPWKGHPQIALLPGSRKHEIMRILPVMLKSIPVIRNKYQNAGFIIPVPSPEIKTFVMDIISRHPNTTSCVEIMDNATIEVLRQADAAIVTSGTATVETALTLCPMIIAYKTSALTYSLGKMLVKIQHIGMVNIIAGQQICPEFIQHDANPGNLANALMPLIEKSSPERVTMIRDFERLREALGHGNASMKAAEIVIQSLNR